MGWLKKTFKHATNPLGSVGGLLGGGKDPGKAQQAGILKAQRETAMQNRSLFAQASYQNRQGLKALDAGYKQANSAIGAGAANAKQGILDRETQNLGALKAGVAANGMGGTSTSANLQRAVYSDSSRQLANVDSEIGALKASLAQSQAQAMAGQYNVLGNTAQNQAGASNQLGQSLINSLGNVQYEDPNAWLQSLFQTGAQVGTAAIFASDRRLKHNIEHVAGLEYEFSYRGSSSRYRGVMADEVPHAVVWRDGVAFVDYSKVPVQFRRVG